MLFGRTTEMMHNFIKMELATITCAVDATMGNGNDTLFLSRFVGESGKVYAFDIQSQAIEATKKRLNEAAVTNVQLIHCSHENMSTFVKNADLIMFNLGYLPKGDHDIVTEEATTCKAIQEGLKLLNAYGLLTVISYYGHQAGKAEKKGVSRLLKGLDQKSYDVLEISTFNRMNNPPIMYLVRKKNNV